MSHEDAGSNVACPANDNDYNNSRECCVTTTNFDNGGLASSEQSHCPICGNPGIELYSGIEDHLFGCPGVWNIKLCTARDCGVAWLDPMPNADDIWKAYTTYYTHHGASGQKPRSHVSLSGKITRYFYKRLLMRILPVKKSRRDVNYMYLLGSPPGRLLEVGCGKGRGLKRFHDLGWQVEGQEVDPVAAQGVRDKFGIPAHVGELHELGIDGETYDAIVLNHVIEHVYNPVGLISECHRLLRKGGTLVVVTPNIESIGHRIFKENWRGLEPPRHICIYTSRALKNVACKSGFANPEVWTTPANAEAIAFASLVAGSVAAQAPDERQGYRKENTAVLFQLAATAIHSHLPGSGEECVLRAVK